MVRVADRLDQPCGLDGLILHSTHSLYHFKMNTKPQAIDELIVKLQNMLPTLRNQYHVQSLEVFGSFVRGDQKAESDLDLLVTFDEIPTLFKFVELENYLGDRLDIKVDLVMKDSLKPAIGERILAEAQPI